MSSSKWDKKGRIKKGYFPPKEKVKYIKILCNGRIIRVARKLFKGNNIKKVKTSIEKAGLIPISFTELMLVINGPYGGMNELEKGSMNAFAKELINLNDCYYTDFRKEFGVCNYEVCAGIGDYGNKQVPDIKSLNSPKYIGFTQSGATFTQARTILDGHDCNDLYTFYPSYNYSPNFVTEIIVKNVKDDTISKKYYIGFGKKK